MSSPLSFAARALLSGIFIRGGLNQLKASEYIAPMLDQAADEYHLPLPVSSQDLVKLNGAGMLVAGTAMATGVMRRPAALALIGMLAATTVVGHPYWKHEGQERDEQLNQFLSNVSTIGGLLLVASGKD